MVSVSHEALRCWDLNLITADEEARMLFPVLD